jgi:peptidoglycan hydrolase CwlO-like protein
MKRALEEQMKKNQEELEEMKKSYDQRMKDAQSSSAVSSFVTAVLNSTNGV